MKHGKICVSLAGVDVAALVEQARQIGDQADVIEVRLDSMLRPEVAKCCTVLDKPLLFTNRPLWEGGAFEGSEERRILPLLEAVRREAAYVDFELRANRRLRKRLLAGMEISSTQMILSWHNFDTTPSQAELEQVLVEMMESGAHIGKIVTTAHSMEDALRVLRLQEQAKEADFPLSCFCMGTTGRISRLATLYLGGYMTYTCLNDAQATAPGQLSLEKLQSLISLLA